jgi:hypothetical protein
VTRFLSLYNSFQNARDTECTSHWSYLSILCLTCCSQQSNCPRGGGCGVCGNHIQSLPGRLSFPAVDVSDCVAEYFSLCTLLFIDIRGPCVDYRLVQAGILNIHVVVFWVIIPYGFVGGCRRFGGK